MPTLGLFEVLPQEIIEIILSQCGLEARCLNKQLETISCYYLGENGDTILTEYFSCSDTETYTYIRFSPHIVKDPYRWFKLSYESNTNALRYLLDTFPDLLSNIPSLDPYYISEDCLNVLLDYMTNDNVLQHKEFLLESILRNYQVELIEKLSSKLTLSDLDIDDIVRRSIHRNSTRPLAYLLTKYPRTDEYLLNIDMNDIIYYDETRKIIVSFISSITQDQLTIVLQSRDVGKIDAIIRYGKLNFIPGSELVDELRTLNLYNAAVSIIKKYNMNPYSDDGELFIDAIRNQCWVDLAEFKEPPLHILEKLLHGPTYKYRANDMLRDCTKLIGTSTINWGMHDNIILYNAISRTYTELVNKLVDIPDVRDKLNSDKLLLASISAKYIYKFVCGVKHVNLSLIYQAIVADNTTFISNRKKLIKSLDDDICQELLLEAVKSNVPTVIKLLINDGRVNPSFPNNFCIKYASKHGYKDVAFELLKDNRVTLTQSRRKNIPK